MIVSIQYLRALAAFLVLLSHVSWKMMQAGNPSISWFHEAGQFGVDIFFIISGYIMSYTTENMHQKPNAVRIFIKKRVIRIIPLYWFLTVVALIIFLVLPNQVNSSGGETNILKSFFLLPVDSGERYLVDVGWTLRYEFIFYALFAVGLYFSNVRGTIIVVSTISLILVVSITLPVETMYYVIGNFLNNLFFEFALGILLYHVTRNIKQLSPVISVMMIVLGILLFYYMFSGVNLTGIRGIDGGISALLICFGFISLEYFWSGKENKLLLKLGDSSYSLYLLHPFVLAFIAQVVYRLDNVIILNDYILIASMIFISLVSGYLCHIWIEKNLIKVAKRVFD